VDEDGDLVAAARRERVEVELDPAAGRDAGARRSPDRRSTGAAAGSPPVSTLSVMFLQLLRVDEDDRRDTWKVFHIDRSIVSISLIDPRPEEVSTVPVPAVPVASELKYAPFAETNPLVSRPSKASEVLRKSPVATEAMVCPVPAISGAEKVTELMVVIASSFSEPATPTYQA
jgi:hypothetical protein